MVQNQFTWKNSIFIKDTVIQIVNMYELLNLISFKRLGTLHLSIITIKDLFKNFIRNQPNFEFKAIPHLGACRL